MSAIVCTYNISFEHRSKQIACFVFLSNDAQCNGLRKAFQLDKSRRPPISRLRRIPCPTGTPSQIISTYRSHAAIRIRHPCRKWCQDELGHDRHYPFPVVHITGAAVIQTHSRNRARAPPIRRPYSTYLRRPRCRVLTSHHFTRTLRRRLTSLLHQPFSQLLILPPQLRDFVTLSEAFILHHPDIFIR